MIQSSMKFILFDYVLNKKQIPCALCENVQGVLRGVKTEYGKMVDICGQCMVGLEKIGCTFEQFQEKKEEGYVCVKCSCDAGYIARHCKKEDCVPCTSLGCAPPKDFPKSESM